MKFRPILFSTPMVKALLEGRKTQTRRIVKLKHLVVPEVAGAIHPDGSGKGWVAWFPGDGITAEKTAELYPGNAGFPCPYGLPGDVLWVRESFRIIKGNVTGSEHDYTSEMLYKADGDLGPHQPSIHMPKSACRIFLEITEVRVERLQDISEEDAFAEGVYDGEGPYGVGHMMFEYLWENINGVDSWKSNPWVWCLTFKRIDKPEGFC